MRSESYRELTDEDQKTQIRGMIRELEARSFIALLNIRMNQRLAEKHGKTPAGMAATNEVAKNQLQIDELTEGLTVLYEEMDAPGAPEDSTVTS